MRKKLEFEWEQVFCNQNSDTIRAKVIGGWLVQTTISDAKRVSTSSVFVPDRDHEWYVLPPKAVPVRDPLLDAVCL